MSWGVVDSAMDCVVMHLLAAQSARRAAARGKQLIWSYQCQWDKRCAYLHRSHIHHTRLAGPLCMCSVNVPFPVSHDVWLIHGPPSFLPHHMMCTSVTSSISSMKPPTVCNTKHSLLLLLYGMQLGLKPLAYQRAFEAFFMPTASRWNWCWNSMWWSCCDVASSRANVHWVIIRYTTEPCRSPSLEKKKKWEGGGGGKRADARSMWDV